MIKNDDDTCQWIKENGQRMIKRPNPVYMVEAKVPDDVQTSEGVMHANVGDYIAFDPLSGHIWPVSAEYVAMHYDLVPEQEAQ